MYLRDTDFPTLGETQTRLIDRRRTWGGSSTEVKVEIGEPDDGAVSGLVTLGKHETPLTSHGLQMLAQYYEIPYKFLERIPADEQQFILTHRIQRAADEHLVVRYDDKGVGEAFKGGSVTRIQPADLIQRIMDQEIFDETAMVLDAWSTADEFRLDIVAPTGWDHGIGGDAKVGDLTHGGVRIFQNRKQNLSPSAQPIMFRLACTNGMEVPRFGLKIEARGVKDPEDIMTMLVANVEEAFKDVEKDIAAFYDLRSVKVDADHTGVLRKMTRELALPDRTIGRMENTLPDALLAEDEVTMFHLVNHVTNQANDPALLSHPNARRSLEQAGGQMISDHAARCERCHSRLN